MMKKILVAIVAMFMMTMSATAQVNNDSINRGSADTFDRISSYLDLTVDQREPAKTAFMQMVGMMESFNQVQDAEKQGEAWLKINGRHQETMKKILTEKQYEKYTQIFDSMVRNNTK